MSTPEDLITLVYSSTARLLFTGHELDTLLRDARRRNEALGVTGLLVYRAGSFIQLLEGPSDTVLDLYDRIAEDPRHRDVRTILEFHTSHRAFPDWPMAFGRCRSTEALHGCVGVFRDSGRAIGAHASSGNPLRPVVLDLIARDLTGFDSGLHAAVEPSFAAAVN